MIRKLMLDIEHIWPELQQKYPAFGKPFIVPARTLRAEAPMYIKRYIDQDEDSNYLWLKCDVTKGPCDRETAAQLFKELFHDKLGLASSYERDEMLSPMEAARKELLPADNDRNYRNFFEEQMDLMRQAMDAEAKEREYQDFEKEHGFRPDDPDIIDVEVVEPERPQIAGPGNRAVGQARNMAVGAPKPIIYGVDLHIPAGGALGWNGGGGRIGRRDPRGPRGFLREDEKLNEGSVIRGVKSTSVAKGGFLHKLDGFIESTKNEMRYAKNAAEMTVGTTVSFEYREDGNQLFKQVSVVGFDNGELKLAETAAAGIATMGDFMDQMIAAGVKKMSDVRSITLAAGAKGAGNFSCYGVGVRYFPIQKRAAENVFAFEFEAVYPKGPKAEPQYGDKANAGKYGDFLSETELSQDGRDEIAGMFAGYSGGGSTWGRRLDAFMDQHAAELQSLRRSQASGLGDFNAARDLGSDELAEGEKADYEDMLKEAVGEPEGPVGECDACGDDDCVDGEKCGLKENGEAPDEDLNEEIDEIVGADESEEDQEAEAREAAAEQFEPLPDDEPEEDDALGESFVRHATMLAKEVW